MSDILLTTLNARYWHSSFGLRYLLANMGELKCRTRMLEFGISDRTVDIIAEILEHQPRVVGIGVYIWNIEQATKLAIDLKRACPGICLVIGGPEVSYETHSQTIAHVADFVITGEADVAFPELCRRLLSDRSEPPDAQTGTFPDSMLSILPQPAEAANIIDGGIPDLTGLQLPYDLYTDEDIANRVIYVEISRGCPFTCEFCLSALDIPVRMFDLDAFLAAMQNLLNRGAKQFKFVDRTFNLNLRVSSAVLEFFLERMKPGLFLHFEMIPDRLPESLRTLIARFPAGVLQFEIGVQTFNEDVGRLISRKQDVARLEDNFRFLREQTGVHIHADLIVGLPGESVQSFGEGFDRLVALRPHEIQVGILKRLKGTPIIRHDDDWQMVYSDHAPFEILSNRLIDFATMHRLRRFARFWDVIANSGNFVETTPLIWADGKPFERFLHLSDWLFETENRTHTIPLRVMVERMFEYLKHQTSLTEDTIGSTILRDYRRNGRRDTPAMLRPFADDGNKVTTETKLPPRQARHAGGI